MSTEDWELFALYMSRYMEKCTPSNETIARQTELVADIESALSQEKKRLATMLGIERRTSTILRRMQTSLGLTD